MKNRLFILVIAAITMFGVISCKSSVSDSTTNKVIYGNIVDLHARKIFPGEITINNGKIAYIKGFGLHKGAIASTIAHDSHNIIALGCDDKDIVTAINKLIAEKGGIAVCNGETIKCLPLPIAGLMTNLKPKQVTQSHLALKQMSKEMGCVINAPFMTMAFMALPVIPDLKLTDMGLFDGIAFEFTPLWE